MFAAANHEPRVTVSGPLDRTASPGSTVRLVATGSDPDRNAVAERAHCEIYEESSITTQLRH